MKGIVLAGGTATRLSPVTKIVNKHILPVYNKPMFYWPLQTLIDSGIKQIAVVSGPPHGDQIKKLLKYFPNRNNIKLSFIFQKKPLGMPDAIMQCRKFAGKSSIIVTAADNIYSGNFSKEILNFNEGAISFLRRVKDPERHGVPVYKNKKLTGIIEKPKNPKTNWIVTGPHIFDNEVFSLIKTLKYSKRDELEITDLLSTYLKKNKLKLIKRHCLWIDAGTFDSLLTASVRVFKMVSKNE